MKLPENIQLDLIAKEIDNGINVHPVPVSFWNEVKELTKGVEVDLDAPLEDDE